MEENNKNLRYYNLLKVVPPEAKKKINGGKLTGMTDINPMWRIMKLTEVFGMCGFGWKYEITKQWNEAYGQVVKTYCNINLYVKVDGEWSEAIPGTGGSSFVAQEKNGTFVSDENNKMALTDALSVAMKALGVGADVYWENGIKFETKYDTNGMVAAGGDMSVNELLTLAKDALAQANSREELKKIVESYPQLRGNAEFLAAGSERKKALGIA